MTAIATKVFDFTSSSNGALEFKHSKATENKVKAEKYTSGGESQTSANPVPTSGTSSSHTLQPPQEKALPSISGSGSIFTWENVEYTVPYLGGERKLLDKVNGYAKPGHMVALMGVSGAGKTTLLNTLSQREKTGAVTGDMLVDGRPWVLNSREVSDVVSKWIFMTELLPSEKPLSILPFFVKNIKFQKLRSNMLIR